MGSIDLKDRELTALVAAIIFAGQRARGGGANVQTAVADARSLIKEAGKSGPDTKPTEPPF